MTGLKERELLGLATAASKNPSQQNAFSNAVVALGRFREPKLLRVQQLTDDQAVRDIIQDQLP